MEPSSPAPLTAAEPSSETIAGRIDCAPNELVQARESWLKYLLDHNRSPKTAKSWRRIIESDSREAGLSRLDQITFGSITTLLADLRARQGWSVATYKSHLAAWKSLDRHIKRVRDGNLQAAEAPSGDGDDGAERAATLEECRAHLAAAWEGQKRDRRSRSPRVIYDALLFLAGLREEEPAGLEWGNFRLIDGVVRFIAWRPDQHKNKTRVQIALCPELCELMTAYRAEMIAAAEVCPTVRVRRESEWVNVCFDPRVADAAVFPIKPPNDVFRRDRVRAGIPYKDERDRTYAPRSARKFFKTQLVLLGLPEDWSEFFMRHKTLAQRYFDSSILDQAERLSALPRVLPASAQALASWGNEANAKRKSSRRLTRPGEIADDGGVQAVNPMPTHLTSNSTNGDSRPGTGGRLNNGSSAAESRLSSCFTAGPSSPADQVPSSPDLSGTASGRFQKESACLNSDGDARWHALNRVLDGYERALDLITRDEAPGRSVREERA